MTMELKENTVFHNTIYAIAILSNKLFLFFSDTFRKLNYISTLIIINKLYHRKEEMNDELCTMVVYTFSSINMASFKRV